jgi:C-terminal processing protease CtpA/Prc
MVIVNQNQMKSRILEFIKPNKFNMSKKILFLFSVALIFVSCASIEKHNLQITKLHPVQDLHDDIDNVYEQLKRHHPRLYQFTSKETLNFKFDSLKNAIKSPMDSRTFYKQLAAVTKYVAQGHMSVSPPAKKFNRKERKALQKTKFDVNNLDFEYLENKLFIANARGNDSVLINAEVLKIENENSQDLIKKYKKIIASDGYNTTFHQRIAGKRILGYYVKDNGRFDSISFTLRNADSTFIKKYKRMPKKELTKHKDSTKTDSLIDLKPKKRLTKIEKKAKRLKAKKIRKDRQKYGYNYLTKENTRGLTFVGEDGKVAMLSIKGFTRGDYEPFYEEVFTTLDSLKTETLVIDVRNNFGGRLNEIMDLYSYLTEEDFTLINLSETNSRIPVMKASMANSTSFGGKLLLGVVSPVVLTHNLLKTSKKDGKIYYKFKAAKEQEPKPLNFKGKIYVLINGNSFSASSVLSAQLKGSKRAIIVGEETGGAYNGTVAGLYKIYELPYTKVKARIGLMHIDTKYKIEPDGYGVKPDVKIIPTYQDRLNKVDPELEWVLKDAKK